MRWILTRHWTLTLLIMCLSVFFLSITTINLFFTLKANLSLIFEHGMMALADGALVQLLELLALSLLCALAYLLFKSCERLLVDKILMEKPAKYENESEG